MKKYPFSWQGLGMIDTVTTQMMGAETYKCEKIISGW